MDITDKKTVFKTSLINRGYKIFFIGGYYEEVFDFDAQYRIGFRID